MYLLDTRTMTRIPRIPCLTNWFFPCQTFLLQLCACVFLQGVLAIYTNYQLPIYTNYHTLFYNKLCYHEIYIIMKLILPMPVYILPFNLKFILPKFISPMPIYITNEIYVTNAKHLPTANSALVILLTISHPCHVII